MELIILIAVFIGCHILTTKHLSDKDNLTKVLDYGHKVLTSSFLTQRQFILDIILLVFTLYAATRLNSKTLLDIVIQYMILYIIRAVSISVTVLPKSNPICKVTKGSFLNNLCNDMVFSGHTVLFLLVLLELFDKEEINRLSVLILLITYGLLIVSARMHYSVDVYLASIITFLFHHYYRTILSTNQ